MKKRCIAVAFLLASSLFGQQGSDPIPETPAGRVLAAWLAAFNSGDAAQISAFDNKYRCLLPPPGQTQNLRDQTGGFALLRVEKNEPTAIQALLQEKSSEAVTRLTLEVSSTAATKIMRMGLARLPASADVGIPRLSEADAVRALSKFVDESGRDDRFSGAVLVAKNGNVIFQKAVGRANRDTGTPATLDTQFRLGSMNKMFTAVATLQLIEAGKLSFDDVIAKHIPEYPNKDLAGKVTVRHLLTHTGGTDDIFGPDFARNRSALREHSDYVNLFGSRGLAFPPGSQYQYSNYGFVLLGRIIEKASGMSYYDYVRTRIYEPAGMKSTASLPENENVPSRSVGYLRQNGAWASNADTLPWRGMAAGGGYSTVGDLLRFALALESGKLISKTMLAQATTSQSQQYGYGFAIQGTGALRNFGHSGGAPGMSGDLRMFSESGYVVVALSNFDPPAANRMIDFFVSRIPL